MVLSNLDDNSIRFFISQPVISAKVKEGLHKAMVLRWTLNKTQQEIAEINRQLKILTDDQARLRANLKEVPADSEIGQRYLKKLNDQETVIERYQADVKKLQTTEHEQRKVFDQYLANFTAE